MSSFIKAEKARRKLHKERGQLESRRHLGVLEKKKDYKIRAKDQKKKRNTLKALHKKALNKNPDEFYFHMINSSTKDGVHVENPIVETHTDAQLKLMHTQDLRYINMKLSIEQKKIARLKSELHLLDASDKPKNSHVYFVDNKAQAKKFDLAKRLETYPELLSRTYNIPRKDTLKKMEILAPTDETELLDVIIDRKKKYKELQKRIERENELHIIAQKMELKKKLLDKKVKHTQVNDETKTSAAVYKWNAERKR